MFFAWRSFYGMRIGNAAPAATSGTHAPPPTKIEHAKVEHAKAEPEKMEVVKAEPDNVASSEVGS